MISRGASHMHICWRCQLRLSNSLPTSYVSSTRLGPSKRTRFLHNDTGFKNAETSDTHAQNLDGSQTVRDVPLASAESERNKVLEPSVAWRPPQNLQGPYGFSGHRMTEKIAELDVATLGRPSEVIILRGSGYHQRPLPRVEDLEVTEKVDILKQLDAERGLVTQAEVEKNIEDLRPNANTISRAEFQDIQQQLVSGFTTSQLVKYFDKSKYGQKRSEGGKKVHVPEGSVEAIIRKTQWMPHISDSGESFVESFLRGYDSEAFSPKQRLALHLMRQYWQVEAQEITESIGEVELEISGREFQLLIDGRIPPLQLISNDLITTQDETIEAFRSRGVVRITAAKEKSDAIIQAIVAMLQNMRFVTIDLNPLIVGPGLPKSNADDTSKEVFGDSLIDELAHLTDTHITRLTENKILVSFVHNDAERHLSTKADIVRRLLLTSSKWIDHTKTIQIREEVSNPLIALKHHVTNGMSWRDRLRHWVRWISASPKLTDSRNGLDLASSEQVAIMSGAARTSVIEMLSDLRSSSIQATVGPSQMEHTQVKIQEMSNAPRTSSWERKSFIEASAIVGHILHEIPATAGVSSTITGDTTAQRTLFHPAPVNLSRLLGNLPLLSDSTSTTLVLRFVPSPWTIAGPKVLASLPPVEMRFGINAITKNLHLKNMIAVVDSSASDVMRPNHNLDLRFDQRTLIRLHKSRWEGIPHVTEFLNASQLNLARERLETPPVLKLPISKHICQEQESDALYSSEDELISAEYIFGGLEYRSTIELDFEGWRLLYTSVEGGKADGRTGQLRLKPQRVSEDFLRVKQSLTVQSREFIEAAHHLVDVLASYDAFPA